MKRPIAILAIAPILFAVAACGSSSSGSGGASSNSSSSNQTSAAPSSVLKVENKAGVGRVVVDDQGFALYTYTPDATNKSNCFGECIKFWPPATVKGSGPLSASGLKGKVTTLTRPDGVKQLVLNGAPLYRFVQDKTPAQVNGQGYQHIWFVIPAKKASSTSGSGTSTASSTKSSGGIGY